ncbi:HEPN domain-containing protein [Dermatophilaceae bacterium Soc4.6]
MSRWPIGEADIEQLIAARQPGLQKVQGGQANGGHLMEKASRTLATSRTICADDPDSAFVLAYDAARYAATALLAHQGLRPTTAGGHYAVEVALRAQFGSGFRAFGALRRRRNELEYPSAVHETTTLAEAREAIEDAADIVDAARQLLPTLGLF